MAESRYSHHNGTGNQQRDNQGPDVSFKVLSLKNYFYWLGSTSYRFHHAKVALPSKIVPSARERVLKTGACEDTSDQKH